MCGRAQIPRIEPAAPQAEELMALLSGSSLPLPRLERGGRDAGRSGGSGNEVISKSVFR